jgi:phosphatidylserine/phosphatidylglycerophosphate/cardiolipin synthase-like enzyme
MASPTDVTTPSTGEILVLDPAERKQAVLDFIRSARQDLILSIFRCDDFKILDALAEAVHRNVRVRAILTPRAKNWDKRLQDLGVFLESMGADVCRYAGSHTKYHAKYMVADQGPALIASLNFTRKCLEKSCDFILVSHDPAVAASLLNLFQIDCHAPDAGLPPDLTDALIAGPEQARLRFLAMIDSAQRSIRIIDHRVTDPEVVAMLRRKQAAGIAVQILGQGAVTGLVSHGKMLLVDDTVAAIGSISLSRPSLNVRREIAAVVRDPANVAMLRDFFEIRGSSSNRFGVTEWSVPERPVEEDEFPDDFD